MIYLKKKKIFLINMKDFFTVILWLLVKYPWSDFFILLMKTTEFTFDHYKSFLFYFPQFITINSTSIIYTIPQSLCINSMVSSRLDHFIFEKLNYFLIKGSQFSRLNRNVCKFQVVSVKVFCSISLDTNQIKDIERIFISHVELYPYKCI